MCRKLTYFQGGTRSNKSAAGTAEAQLGKAKLDVERDTPLAEARAIGQSQLDTEIQAKLGAETLVQAAKANVEEAELNLGFTKVTTLISGVAGIAQVQIGNLVGPNSVLTSVSQVDPIKAYLTIDEQTYTDFHRRFPTEEAVAEARKNIVLQLILSNGRVYEHPGRISFAESWSLPFSVLLSTPVAVFGAFLFLWPRRWILGLFLPPYRVQIETDVYSQIGLVMLIGPAAKNAILIVEFAKDAYEHGQPLTEAALAAPKVT